MELLGMVLVGRALVLEQRFLLDSVVHLVDIRRDRIVTVIRLWFRWPVLYLYLGGVPRPKLIASDV